jgi:MerR family transcriptional regulator, thiopeptide resistance regulator
MAFKVGEVSRLAGVSVRTLHHYDEIGLLRPTERSESGHRVYTPRDLELLQEVLFYKELGFSLEDVRAFVSEPGLERRQTLLLQRDLIAENARRMNAILHLIDKTLASMEKGTAMSTDEMFEVFGDFDPAQHEEEARERWGDTDAYRESAHRSARYTKKDWLRFKDENEQINAAIIALMDEGVSPEDPRAMDAVDRARLLIDRWFYPCSREMHAALGEMYIADPCFTATYEKMHAGMASYVREAIKANLQRDS